MIVLDDNQIASATHFCEIFCGEGQTVTTILFCLEILTCTCILGREHGQLHIAQIGRMHEGQSECCTGFSFLCYYSSESIVVKTALSVLSIGAQN